jgi:transposase
MLATFRHHELSPHFGGSTQSNIFVLQVAHQPTAQRRGTIMEVINERCCGLDVHKKRVVACVITPEGQETRTFSTLTQGLLELAAWLGECQVSHVAMESSGVFWKPVYNLLEGLDLTYVISAAPLKELARDQRGLRRAEEGI